MNKEMLWVFFFFWIGTGIACQFLFGYFNPFNVSATVAERVSLVEGSIIGWVGHAFCRWFFKPSRGVESTLKH